MRSLFHNDRIRARRASSQNGWKLGVWTLGVWKLGVWKLGVMCVGATGAPVSRVSSERMMEAAP